MKPQHFAALAVAAALSLIAAIVVYSASIPWSRGVAGGGKLFPDLAASGADIAQVEITSGPDKLTLERTGDTWQIKERGGFPANAEKIRALVTAMTEAKLIEPKTENEQRYPILEVEDPTGKNAGARLIRLLDAKGAVIAETIAGKRRPGGLGSGQPGTYVRKPGETRAWLADADLTGGTDLRDWTKSRIFEISADKIKKLTVALEGEQPYDIVSEAGEHKLTEIPAGKKIKFVNLVDNIVEASAYIDFDDVRKAEGEPPASGVSTVTLETDTGLKVTYTLHTDNDTTWLRFTATGEGDAKKAADDLAARTSGWEYKILPSKVSSLLKKRDEFLEDAES